MLAALTPWNHSLRIKFDTGQSPDAGPFYWRELANQASFNKEPSAPPSPAGLFSVSGEKSAISIAASEGRGPLTAVEGHSLHHP